MVQVEFDMNSLPESSPPLSTEGISVMIQKFFMLITEANSVEEGIAQILVQLRMLGKRELDQTDFEFEIEKIPLIGIITTGGVWVFIRNTGQKIEISEEFECSYTGNMEGIKIVSSYIVRLLQAQVTEINNQRLKRSHIDQ
ncbi:hypothetical protein RhiirB3_442442 [Rhizophagus irregularis]|nr:hypothetical protein RhiirB3_442442 [Rhizophagus irregularis]